MPRSIWFLPSFLCLVAPLVAVGWALLFSQEIPPGVGGPSEWEFAALFSAVWLVYLADRIHDALRNEASIETELAPRHLWARHHRRLLGLLVIPALLPGIAALPGLQGRTWIAGAVLAALTGIYFAVFRWTQGHLLLPRWFPAKEVGVATVFAGGAAIAGTAGTPVALPPVLLAGTLCLFAGNCLLIARAEREWDLTHDPCAYFTTEGNLSRLPELAFLLALVAGIWTRLADGGRAGLVVAACATASVVAGRWTPRHRLHPLADAILLLPWIFVLLPGVLREIFRLSSP